MQNPNEMIDDLKEITSVVGVNVAAIAVSLSEIEQAVRILAGIAAIVYTVVKIYKLIQK
jgi:hypothetical protein